MHRMHRRACYASNGRLFFAAWEGAMSPMAQYLVTMDLPEADPDGTLPSIEGLLGTIRKTILPSPFRVAVLGPVSPCTERYH